MRRSFFLALALLMGASFPLYAQHWSEMMTDTSANFYDVQQAFESYWKDKDHTQKGKGWKPFKRWEWFTAQRVYPSGDLGQMNQAMKVYFDQVAADPIRGSGPGGDWSFMGPSKVPSNGGGAGRLNFLRFDPSDPNILWTGSPGGGLWKSTDAGASWTNWNTDNLPVIGCSDILIDPTDTDILYLATGDGDAGDTYSVGVLKSTDGGLTWAATGLGWDVSSQRRIRKLIMHPTNSQIIHAATSAGIFRTVNGGVNWTQVQPGDFYDLEYHPTDPQIVYGSSKGFFRSTNGGTSWTQISTGLPTTNLSRRMALAVTPASPNTVYVLAANSADNGYLGLYRSTDSGSTFSTRSESPNILGWSSNGDDSGGQGWYDLAVAASPTDANAVYVGGVNIWRSVNGGQDWGINGHWYGDQAPYVHADIHDLIFKPGSGNTVYAATDGGLFRTSNNGQSWSDLSDGLEIAQLYRLGLSATDDNLVISGWQDNGTNRLNDGNWARVVGGDGMECIVDHKNASTMYGALYYGNIRKSTNGGQNFFTIVESGDSDGVNSGGLWVTPYIMHPTENQTLLVGKNNLYRSTDGGSNWETLGNIGGGGLISHIAYAPSNPNVIYVSRTNTISVSTDGGNSFSNITNGLPNLSITYIAVSSASPSVVYVTYSGYLAGNKVFVSYNGGQSWTNYSNGLPNLPVNCIVFEKGSANAVYAGTDVGVYYRDGNKSSWEPFSTGLPNVVVTELEIQYDVSKIRASTYGRGIWESTIYSGTPQAPEAVFANPASACSGISVKFTNLSTNNPINFQWAFEGGMPASSNLSDPEVTWLSPGTYNVTLTVTNVAGTSTVSKTIEIRPTPAVVLTPESPSVCKGSSITLSASGASTYLWSNNLGPGPSKKVTPASTTTYTVTGNLSGCTSKSTITVEVLPLPTVSLAGSKTTLCEGESVFLTASGASIYQWDGGLGTEQQLELQPSATTTYSVTGTDVNGCSAQASFTVEVFAKPSITITPSKPEICEGEVLVLEAAGASSYTWAGGWGNEAIIVLNPSSGTTYQVSGTSAQGCVSTAEVTIPVNPLPEVQIAASTQSVCDGEALTLSASGAATYLWSGGLGSEPLLVFNPLQTATYTVTGLSEKGCAGTAAIDIGVYPRPSLSVNPDQPKVCLGEEISLLANGAEAYRWSGGLGEGESKTVALESTTTFILAGRSAQGCEDSITVTVQVLALPNVSVEPAMPVICPGGNIQMNVYGAESYNWSDGLGAEATVIVSPSSSTIYSVTGISADGCSKKVDVPVTVQEVKTQITPWPDPTCSRGLYRLEPAATLAGIVLPTGVSVDTTQMPHFLWVTQGQAGDRLELLIQEVGIACPVELVLDQAPNTTIIHGMDFDHCRMQLVADLPCTMGTWYRFGRADGQFTIVGAGVATLTNVDRTSRENHGYIFVCDGPCAEMAILPVLEADGYEECLSAGTFEMQVRPNPADVDLSVLISHSGTAVMTVRIWDVTGRLLGERKVEHPGGELILPYTVSDWPSGVYVLEVERNDGKSLSRKVVIQ